MYSRLLISLSLMLLLVAPLVASGLKDPTRPSGFVSGVLDNLPESPRDSELSLQAIFYNPQQPAVLINGRRFKVGDVIGDSRIDAIHADRVELVSALGRTSLFMSLPEVKSPPAEAVPARGNPQ